MSQIVAKSPGLLLTQSNLWVPICWLTKASQELIPFVRGSSQCRFLRTEFDIALQPTVTEYASPPKFFEYKAMGKAIIAPDQEDIREVLSGEGNAVLMGDGGLKAAIQSLAGLEPSIASDARQRSWIDNAITILGVLT